MATSFKVYYKSAEGHVCPDCGVTIPTPEMVARHVCAKPAKRYQRSQADCVYRGPELRRDACPSCAGHVEIKVFGCYLHGECAIGKTPDGVRSCQACRDYRSPDKVPYNPRLPWPQSGGNPFVQAAGVPQFVSIPQFGADIRTLASLLPPNVSRVIGVARSGVYPATMVAMLLHRPLSIVRQSSADLIEAGNGWRLSGNTGGDGPAVVIDDTCMTGNSLLHVLPIVRKSFPEVISATVYCNPFANHKPDYHARDLGWPHVLEWNVFNSILTPNSAFDFDGIFCRDCRPEEDDDGPRYREFLASAEPLYYVRKDRIPMIVTARLEKYRAETLAWLDRHGMQVDKLIMMPCDTLAERQRLDVAQFKAVHYRQFMDRHTGLKPTLFVESDPHQAERIAKFSGGITACPAAARCFYAPRPA